MSDCGCLMKDQNHLLASGVSGASVGVIMSFR